LIYTSRNSIASYAFGVIWLFLAFIQLVTGTVYIRDASFSDSLLFILLSVVNFIFAGYSIYKTRILNDYETGKKAIV